MEPSAEVEQYIELVKQIFERMQADGTLEEVLANFEAEKARRDKGKFESSEGSNEEFAT